MENKGNALLSVYGCRKSKNGSRVNITLIGNEDNNKSYYTACVKLDNSGKVKAKETQLKDGKKVFAIYIPILEDKPKEEKPRPDITTDDLPF